MQTEKSGVRVYVWSSLALLCSLRMTSRPCRTGTHAVDMLFLQGRGSRSSCWEFQHRHRCTQDVCVHAKKWKTEPALHSLSLLVFFISWQREMQSKIRKCQEVPVNLATGQCKGYGSFLPLQSSCLLLTVLPGTSVSPREEACVQLQCKACGLQAAMPSPASLLARGVLRA